MFRGVSWRWMRKQSRTGERARQRSTNGRSLHVESLEDRRLLSIESMPLLAGLDALAVDASEYSASNILVGFRAAANGRHEARQLPGTRLGRGFSLVPGLREVRIDAGMSVAEALAAYRADPQVAFAEPDYRVYALATPNDPSYDELWGLHNIGQTAGIADADIDAAEAWDITQGNSGTLVAVIDTGVDYRHPDLSANIWTNPGEIAGDGVDNDHNGYVDDVHGYDFINNDGDPMDDHGHGTHVAGTIGAVGNNGIGVTGINWNTRIMALKFLDSSGSGSTSDAIEALEYAVAMGAQISNNSYGGDPFSQSFYNALVNARDAGHVFVAAAGNNGMNNDTSPFFPANYELDNIVSVAATDDRDQLAYFSNYGQATVDLAAPGVDILSTKPGNAYQLSSGTSMAAPHVAGVLTLVRSQHPDWSYGQVIQQVTGTVDCLPSLAGRTTTGGRLNAARAVGAPDTEGPRVVGTSPAGAISGSISSLRIDFSETIDPASFTTADIVSFDGPDGPIAVTDVQPIAGSLGRSFAVSFPTQSAKAAYALVLGPWIQDQSGNAMDQDGDGAQGEVPDDRYTATFSIADAYIFPAADVPVPLAFFGSAVSQLEVGQDLIIDDVNVSVDLRHPAVQNLWITLVAPDGTTVTLTQLSGSGSDFAGTVFDDEASLPLSGGQSPYQGSYLPASPLAALDGKPAQGTWQLRVTNWGLLTGTVEAWSLILQARLPEISISDASIAEGDSGVSLAAFTATLSTASLEPVTVDFATADGTGVAGEDYVATSGSVTFLPGEKTKPFTVRVYGDLVDEDDETFLVNLSNPRSAVLADPQAVGRIQNDESWFVIDDTSLVEGDSGTVAAVLTLRREGAVGRAASVGFATAAGSAQAGSDFAATSGTLLFAPGETAKTVSVLVNGDTGNEADEAFTVTLADPTNAVISRATATATILNDDPVPMLAIGDEIVVEGDDGTKYVYFDVSLSAASGRTVSVDYQTRDGSALGGSDYLVQAGTLSFAPGRRTLSLKVPISVDTEPEPDETFLVLLTNPSGARLIDADAVGTIRNDDTRVSIDDAAALEGNGGVTALSFTARLSSAVAFETRVDYATAGGTATSGTDFLARTGTLVFAPGESVKTIDVPIIADTLNESDAEFTVKLSNAANVLVDDDLASGRIIDDDPQLPGLTVGDVSVSEGAAGTKTAAFAVRLSEPSGRPITVEYTTADGTARAADGDYLARTGRLTFYPGSTSQTVYVTLYGDTTAELDETLFLSLTTADGAEILDGTAQATILDDDSLRIDDVSILEGDTGVSYAAFRVSIALPRPEAIRLEYSTDAGTAASGADFAGCSGSITLLPGETEQTILVPVAADVRNEADETFTLELTSPDGLLLADSAAVCTIVDDDPQPEITIDDVAIAEGNSGTRNVNLTARLSAPSGQKITVAYTTADGTATAGSDYTARSGMLTFYAGSTTQTISVTVLGDTVVEPDESFLVRLSSPTNVVLVDAEAEATLASDDPAPAVWVDDAKLHEGASGTKNLSFAVKLSATSTATISVGYATVDGTASAGADYSARSGTLVFSPGQSVKYLYVPIVGDTFAEPDEAFTLRLASPVNAVILQGEAIGTIQNDDLSLRMGDIEISERDDGVGEASLIVSLSAPAAFAVEASYATSGGTATSGTDYISQSGLVTFAPGEITRTISVPILADRRNEASETIYVSLSDSLNATIADSQGVITITDDDSQLPAISIADAAISEGDSGTKYATLKVSLSAASGRTITVDYATLDDSASAGSDYTAKSGRLTINPGVTAATITVPLVGDTDSETDETFLVRLSNPSFVTILNGEAQATILDDDSLRIGDTSLVEGPEGVRYALFTVSLLTPRDHPVSVQYATAAGSARAGTDYATARGTIVFAPGDTQHEITVVVAGDARNEAEETFTVDLSQAVGAILDDDQGVCTIVDDDPLPELSVSGAVIAEGNSGERTASFTVRLSAPSGRTVTVAYATADGSALAGSDYTAGAGTLTFNAGYVAQTVSVPIRGDTLLEGDESFLLRLSGAVNALLAGAEGEALILDDDGTAPGAAEIAAAVAPAAALPRRGQAPNHTPATDRLLEQDAWIASEISRSVLPTGSAGRGQRTAAGPRVKDVQELFPELFFPG